MASGWSPPPADKTARVWDAQTGQPLTDAFQARSEVAYARFSPDGKRIVTASEDNTARVWDAQTGQPLTEPMEHAVAVISAQFSPDGRRVVTGSANNTATVWDAATVPPLNTPLPHGGGAFRAIQSRRPTHCHRL